MPINSTPFNEGTLRAYREAMEASQQEAIQHHATGYGMDIFRLIHTEPPTKQTAAQRTEKQDTIEIQALESFMRTGRSGMVYGKDGAIFMIGQDRKPTHILFAMDKTTVRAHKTRVKHLKPLLEELAEREGLKLELSTKVPEVGKGCSLVSYYAFKRFKVDDTELVTAARPRNWRGNSEDYEACGNCGHCGDPNCEDCSHCGLCRPDDLWDDEPEEYDEEEEDLPF